MVEPVRFAELDEARYLHGADGHPLRLSDAVPNGKEYDAQNHEHEDEDVNPFGLDLRLHDIGEKSETGLPTLTRQQFALVFNCQSLSPPCVSCAAAAAEEVEVEVAEDARVVGGGEGGGEKARIMGGGVASAKDNRSPVLIDIPLFPMFLQVPFRCAAGEHLKQFRFYFETELCPRGLLLDCMSSTHNTTGGGLDMLAIKPKSSSTSSPSEPPLAPLSL